MSVATQIIDIVRRKADEAFDEIGQILVSEEDMLAILDELGPIEWEKTGELEGQTYTWPEGTERYDPFEVWEGGGLKLGVGYREMPNRSYVAIFKMGEGSGKRPIVYFTDADDFASTRERVSPIRGNKDGGRSFFGPGDQLPPAYDGMTIDSFRGRIAGRWNVQAVVAKEDDVTTMLNHAAAQIRLRNL